MGHDDAAAANARVVPDLDQIINFGALADDRVAESAAIDRRVRADFHIVLDDDAAELRYFEVARRAADVAEAVLADAACRRE